jgi:ribonuclease HI
VETAGVVISTDGSVAFHAERRGEGGRPGGWAFVNHATLETRMGRVAAATVNQMELLAVIEAIRSVDPQWPIIIRTDSQYVHGVIERGVIVRGNAPTWREYEEVAKSRRVKVEWIKGHAGDLHNALVDRLAGRQARLAVAELAQNGSVSSDSDCGVSYFLRRGGLRLRRPQADSQAGEEELTRNT